MSSKPTLAHFTPVAMTVLALLASVATTAHALDTCHAAIYHLPGAPSEAAAWESNGFVVDVDQELPDFSPARVGRAFYGRRAGTALVFTTKNDFSLMMRPTWRDPNVDRGAAALSFNAAAFARAFARRKPTCASLVTLVEQAKFRFDASTAALAYLENPADHRDFSWSDFILSYENAMYLRLGAAIPSTEMIEAQRALRSELKLVAQQPAQGLDGVARLTNLIFKKTSVGKYCSEGNTFSSMKLMDCTACQGSSTVILAGLLDSGLRIPAPYQLGLQMFLDHWRPVLWDPSHSRFKDLSAGGGWITRVTDPIYRPEFILDTLLRSPISGLAPEVRRRLPARDPYYWLLIDANEEKSILPSWAQRKLKTPELVSYPDAAEPGGGIARYFRAMPRTNYSDRPAATRGTLAFRNFTDDVKVDRGGLADRLGEGEDHDAQTDGRPDDELLAMLSLADVSPADRTVLEPLKRFATQNPYGGWAWTRSAGTPPALALQRAVRAHYSIGALARLLGSDRLVAGVRADSMVDYSKLDVRRLFSAVPLSEVDRAYAQRTWDKLSLIERILYYDRMLNLQWQKTTHDPRFELVLSYLERPVDGTWQTNAADLEAMTEYIRYVAVLAKTLTDLHQTYEGIHLQPSLFRGPDPGLGLITTETQVLYAAIFAHAQNLAREYRTVVAHANRWPPRTTLAFARFYESIGSLAGPVFDGGLNVPDIRAKWPDAERSPNLFKRRTQFPLLAVYENILADPQFAGVFRRARVDGKLRSMSETVGPRATPAGPVINLPVVDWGPTDPCRGAAPGALQISNGRPGDQHGVVAAGVAVECPEVSREDALSQGLTAELTYALIVNQPSEFLRTPNVQVRTTLLWTPEVEALANRVQIKPTSTLENILFSPNALMMNSPGFTRAIVGAGSLRECALPHDIGWSWGCVIAKLPARRDYRAPIEPDLSWLSQRPEYREGYRRWRQQVARRRLSPVFDGSEGVYMSLEMQPSDEGQRVRRAAIVDGIVLTAEENLGAPGPQRVQLHSLVQKTSPENMTIDELSRAIEEEP